MVFEAVGVPGIIDDVMRRARHGTRLVVVGVCMQADTMHPFFGIAKEISVQFVLAYDPQEFGDSLRAIAEGDIDVSPVITGVVGLEGVGAAFDDLADPNVTARYWSRPRCRRSSSPGRRSRDHGGLETVTGSGKLHAAPTVAANHRHSAYAVGDRLRSQRLRGDRGAEVTDRGDRRAH